MRTRLRQQRVSRQAQIIPVALPPRSHTQKRHLRSAATSWLSRHTVRSAPSERQQNCATLKIEQKVLRGSRNLESLRVRRSAGTITPKALGRRVLLASTRLSNRITLTMSVGAASASAAIDLDCQYSGFRLTPGQSLAEVIPRVAIAELTAERFFAEFVSTRRPCIVVGHPRLPHSEATAACAPSASKRPRTEAGGGWNLPNELLAEVAGEAQVAVEVGQPQTQGNQCFGHSERQTMPFATFLERLGSGDESLYLTAQTTQQDDTERPGLCAAPAEQLLLHQQIPLTVPLAGSLVLAQIK